MCAERKQFINHALIACVLTAIAAMAPAVAAAAAPPASAGGVVIGESHGGIADEAYVIAPPSYLYVVEKEPGSFLDCGEGQEARETDKSGRDAAALACGVNLTETVVIPAAASSARIIIHY